MGYERYFDHIIELLQEVKEKEEGAIHSAAKLVADTIMKGSIIQAFGSGHSRAAAMEISQRAGGLVPVKLLDEPSQGRYEKVKGLGTTFMQEVDARPGDCFIIISNSGNNPLPVEIATCAKKVGCSVIAVTSKEIANQKDCVHLHDLADVVLDLHSCHGDAAMEVEGVKTKVCGTSSVCADVILNSVMLEAIEIMVEQGYEPPVLLSGNIEGGMEYGRKLVMRYMDRLLRNHTYYY